MTDTPSQQRGKYHILQEIGRGGFGVVYQAHDPGLDRIVALKVLAPYLMVDPGFVAQFHREAQLVARLDHPHIVTVYDVGEDQGQHFIAMQYVEGQSLDRRLSRGQPWPPEQVLPLAEQIAQALDYAHAQGVLHLDLKPGNILLADDGRVWLTDFGLGRAAGGATQPASVMTGGTAAYLSPEQADLEEPRPITPLADIYAFGVVLYQLCTGRVPFEGNPIAVANAHVNQQPPRPTLLNDGLSQAVEEVLLRALAKSPQARFPDAASLVEALAEAVRTGQARPSVARVITVEPFILGDFRVRTLRELALACEGVWEEAVEQLYDGSLEKWLTEARVLGAAAEAERIRKEQAEAQGREREVGLEEFLLWTGYVTDPALGVKPETLDFGAEEKGYGYRLRAILTVQNAGRGLLWGEVISLAPWVEVLDELRFWLRPGERQEVLLEADLDALPSGQAEVTDAVAVRTQVGEQRVGARVEVWGPEVHLDPMELDLGEVGEGEEVVRTLTVANRGRGALMGTVSSDASWLTVVPERFRCTAGRRQVVQVRVDSGRLPAARRALEASITLETNEGVYSVPARVVNPSAMGIMVPELVRVPAGPFTMGSDEIDGAKPVNTVNLPEYWIGKYPVTNEEYACFIHATGYPAPYQSNDQAKPYNWQGNNPPRGKEKHPVVLVNWHDAVAYCHWLSDETGEPYCLPTEAEWEKAARGTGKQVSALIMKELLIARLEAEREGAALGTDGRIYPWGYAWDAKQCNTQEGKAGSTTPVGQYPQGASPYGALDMAGNVWEWCSSLYQGYPYRPDDGREDMTSSGKRVLRGGSWISGRDGARCAVRLRSSPVGRSNVVGFRCCAVATSSL